MKTENLITLLVTGTEAVEMHVTTRRYAMAIGIGLASATLLMATLLRVRPDLFEAARLPMFWIKIGFVTSLCVASLIAVMRLSRPGARLDWVLGAIALPVLVMWAIAVYVLIEADPQQRSTLLFGETWKTCPFLIAMLSAPIFVAVMWAMKGLAPTQLRLAGFAAGLFSGAAAALVYSLHCPELGAPFVSLWYLLGMLIPAGTGAWLGESLLRW